MNQTQNTPSKRESEQEHRKQVTWQILVPILAAVAIALGIALLEIFNAGPENVKHSQWAMISTILLVLGWLILGLVPLALVILGIWLTNKSRKSITPYLAAGNVMVDRVKTRAQGIAEGMTAPMIRVRSANAGLMHLLKIISHLNSSSKE